MSTVAPPLFNGAAHVSVTVVSPTEATTDVGAVGTVRGVAPADAEAVPAPAELMALTRNAYAVPFVRPVTTTLVPLFPVFAIAVTHVVPPSADCSTL